MANAEASEKRHYIFAGGGTGGHIYPALALAERISSEKAGHSMLFFCSSREIDSRILSQTGYEFLPLPAIGFSLHPVHFIRFYTQFIKSYYFVKQILTPIRKQAVVIGTGGFVAAPVLLAARSLKIPIYLLNVDIVPGKANRFLGRLAKKVFVQFDQTREYFKEGATEVVGCPIRAAFQNPDKHQAFSDLALEENKKVLLITGASSGALNINNAMISILPELDEFAAEWQVVHLTGLLHIEDVRRAVQGVQIPYQPVDYYDDMPALLAAADIIVGRSGAVSVAEYAAAGKPAICIPYPYHKDKHQYKNAQVLADAGAAVVVEDDISSIKKTAHELLQVLRDLMANPGKRARMSVAGKQIGVPDSADRIYRYISQDLK